ncbi:hypothetical protein [Thermomonospora cellulosilytica]|uniref:Mce-associated membrane protein n=1 Tax=Thermomonospora cellulosilytica TaxID=1411118 RepID=A0A7W3R933_9ACTN|nr:hypothetical protein [Thermomonospora cellulosilytica]MBA9004322.1 Mce-associated membrane protein [Thermomonospora cellulosilytica]
MPIPHHVLQQRRRGGAAPGRAREDAAEPKEPEVSEAAEATEATGEEKPAKAPKPEKKQEEPGPGRLARIRTLLGRPVTLGIATVLLGAVAAWSAVQADRLRSGTVAENVALTDTARTSEVKGQLGDAVNELFSYRYTDMAKTEQAARRLLTGKAVQQYQNMMEPIRRQAAAQKLVLTTTVTDSGVRMLSGDRARMLFFVDQRSTRTAQEETTYAGAMLAVDAVKVGDTWKITNIDTLNVPR